MGRDFHLEVALPALADRLDQAFPEFGWRSNGAMCPSRGPTNEMRRR
jgi:hypothetical protein